METDEFGTVFVLSERRDVNGRGFRYGFKDIRFYSTVADPSGFNSRCKRAMF